MLLVTFKKRLFGMYDHTLICPAHSVYPGLQGPLYTHIRRSLKHMMINLNIFSDHAE